MEIYLPEIDCTLNCSTTPLNFNSMPALPTLYYFSVICKGDIIASLVLDERFNTLQGNPIYLPEKKIKPKIDYIKSLYNALKLSNTEYGTMGMEEYYEYEPKKAIRINDFFEYLKVIKRDDVINKIIDD